MSSAVLRNSMKMASRPQQRLASIQRQFSSSAPQRKEIRDAYIISASRTPTAVFNGNFTTVSAPQLGATAIKSALEKSKVPVSSIDAVYMGNVLGGGVGQAPARQAAIFAGLPTNIEATTINKVCASGLKAVSIAASTIELGQAEAQVAGGMENMTRVPYYLSRASQQPAFGHQKLEDGLISDGLWDVYNQIHMGNCAENTAKKYEVSRQDQDDYAIETYKRAQQAYKDGLFKDEIVPVTVKTRKGETIVSEDEQYNKLKLDKVPTLKPAFEKGPNGTVTAANSSPLSDGASALVLGSKEIAQKYGKDSRVLAKIVTYADAALDPIDFPIAPASCVEKLLAQSSLSKSDIAIWEFNEAFAAVIKANAKILGLDSHNVNPRGGAIALGHALGSSGSRILVTLLHQLKVGQYGAAVICNGGGAASGMIVKRVGPEEL
ncbi:Acetyl-CoA acetyltransferase [Curvularia clavata]|uniref:acetyl-CoA C-acetyltransferase n=1 Tax=Curvularia clavata TaxID=95742 RepID=A0A9Q9DXE2_CURCL|nr:Acetyl-CoA acetyltransferase [Curvularia clavata]